MRKLTVWILGLAALAGTAAHAETLVEVRPFTGVYLPSGHLRDVLGDALLIGGQTAMELAEPIHLVGTFAFTAPEPRHLAMDKDLHIYQADFGVEAFRSVPLRGDWRLRPFLGLGLGGRVLNYDRTHTYFTGYASLGTEFQLSRLALRVEARNYLTRWEGLMGDQKAKWRDDLMLTAGAGLHLASFDGADGRSERPGFELRPFAGVYLPTGDQRDALKDAIAFGIQGAMELTDPVHLVGTLAFTSPEARNTASSQDVSLYQADLGTEVFSEFPFRENWNMRPFLGLGLGARSNDFHEGRTQFAGYGSLGTELQISRTALRVEWRDYLTRFKGPMGSEGTAWRNDMMLMAGFSFHL